MDGLFNVTDLNDFRKKSFRLIQESEGPKDFHTNLFGDEKQFQKKSVKSDFRPKYVRPMSGKSERVIDSTAKYINHIKNILLDNGMDTRAAEFIEKAYSLNQYDDIFELSKQYVKDPHYSSFSEKDNPEFNFYKIEQDKKEKLIKEAVKILKNTDSEESLPNEDRPKSAWLEKELLTRSLNEARKNARYEERELTAEQKSHMVAASVNDVLSNYHLQLSGDSNKRLREDIFEDLTGERRKNVGIADIKTAIRQFYTTDYFVRKINIDELPWPSFIDSSEIFSGIDLEDSAYVDDETDEEALFNEWKSDIPYETAKRAHYGTSMSPDKRGHQERESYAVMLNDVYKIRKQAERLGREKDFDSDFAVFRRKFRDLYLDSLNAKSRVLSPMISGPANFPTRRNQKANNTADAKNSDMLEYKKKTLRRFELEYRPETDKPILTGAADSLQKLKDKLQSLYRSREAMKEANKIIRSGKDVIPRLQKMGYSDKDIHGIMNPYFGKPGFAAYAFQNLSSEISRVKDRILQEEKLQTVKESGETMFDFDGGYIKAEIEANRWRIYYNEKPDKDTISLLKKNGWKWSPSARAWQRFYTSWPKSRFSLIGIALQEPDKEEFKESRTDTYGLEEPESIQEESEETADEFEEEFIQELEEDYQPEYQGNYTGRKYQETKNMDISQIAKLIRNDIREAIKKKKLPSHPKYSVTIERYSMGQSVTVRVTEILPLRIMNEQVVINELSHTSFHGSRLNQAGKNMDNILTDICRQYGFDNSDSMTDYSHSRFHTHISLQTDPEYNLIKSEYEQRKEIERTEQKKSVQSARKSEIEYRPKENLNILDFQKRKDFIPAQRNENLPALRVNQPIETVRPRQNLFEVHSVDDLFQDQERTIELNRYQDDSWRFPKKNDFQLHGPENLQRLPFGSSKKVKGERMTEEKRKKERKEKKIRDFSVSDMTPEEQEKLIEMTNRKFQEALTGKTKVTI